MFEQPSPLVTVRPFSFSQGWETNGQAFPPVNFAEQQCQQCMKFAWFFKQQRDPSAEAVMLDKADWWRKIAAQTSGDSEPHEYASYSAALEPVGILLTRAKQGSNEAAGYLRELMETIASNLCSLAAHENGIASAQAASALVKGLSKAVSDFETLAKIKPDSLLPETRSAMGVPGIISPASEKVKDNIALVTQLEIGTDSLFYLPTMTARGKTMRLVTGPNLWAARLIGYIYSVRAELDRKSHLRAAYERGSALGNDSMNDFFSGLHEQVTRADEYTPEWLQEAMDLQAFSPDSWQSWFEVAWRVIFDVTDGKPETEPALRELGKSGANKPVSYRHKALEGTKTSNIRSVSKARLRKAFEVLANRDRPRAATQSAHKKIAPDNRP